MWNRAVTLAALALPAFTAACGARTVESDGATPVGVSTAGTNVLELLSAPVEPAAPSGDEARHERRPAPRPRGPLTCGDRVPVYEDGARQGEVCASEAAREGLTVLDLSDGWAPVIFSEAPELGAAGSQPYRKAYIALADERFEAINESRSTEQYLELYGIFPTFRVIRERLGQAERHACHDAVDDRPLEALAENLHPSGRQEKAQRDAIRQSQALRQRLEREREREGAASIADLAAIERLRPVVERYQRGATLVESVAAMQAHLRCDGFLGPGRGSRDGAFDGPTLAALRRWQRRHMVISSGVLSAEARRILTLDSREADFHAALRALRERVVDATGLIEDGSARRDWGTVLGRTIDTEAILFESGQPGLTNGAPDAVSVATEAAARALGWTSPQALAASLDGLGEGGTRSLRVAVRLPEPPSYHSEHMELRAEIDRGDVYYDPGNRRRGIEHRPILTLYARDGDREVALVRWGTTIGGWQPENTEDGGIGVRYKNSPPGERIWRDIVASPAWLPPASTPDEELVQKRGTEIRPKLGLFGPGYQSAYGLVMMMHHKVLEGTNARGEPRFLDEGIRTHGSVTYSSILGGYSHGCHRLYNHLAVRLAGFLLRHRHHVRRGSIPVDYNREVVFEDQTLDIELRTRGYLFELTPPVPVNVLEGNILGRTQEPITRFLNVRYPEAEADGSAALGTAPAPTGTVAPATTP